MAKLFSDMARQATLVEPHRIPLRARHGVQSLPKLCCRMLGPVGLSLDTGFNFVLLSSLKRGETLVDHQETNKQILSGISGKIAPDWGEIFEQHPELSPPGYREAVEATKELVELRRLRQREAPALRTTATKSRRTLKKRR